MAKMPASKCVAPSAVWVSTEQMLGNQGLHFPASPSHLGRAMWLLLANGVWPELCALLLSQGGREAVMSSPLAPSLLPGWKELPGSWGMEVSQNKKGLCSWDAKNKISLECQRSEKNVPVSRGALDSLGFVFSSTYHTTALTHTRKPL